MISVVVVDSRGDRHPDWVQTCLDSVKSQPLDIDLIVINNRARKKTIGQCFNEAVRKAKGEWVFFLGDDDYISKDYLSTLTSYVEDLADRRTQCITTYMMALDDKTGYCAPLQRPCTGMWRREYLLKYPFNEKLKSGVDREYLEEAVKRGDNAVVIPHHYGYYYRKHDDYSCAGKIKFTDKGDIYILAKYSSFIAPIAQRLQQQHSVFLTLDRFDARVADQAKIIWCEWADENAILASKYKCKAKKILRIHAYEVYDKYIDYIDLRAFDKILFVADHIKRYAEDKFGKLENAVVIPNGVELNKYKIVKHNRNKDIAWAGYISRKKGVQLLLFLAAHLPDYRFHVAGKFQEADIAQFFQTKKPDNVILYPWQYNLDKFFEGKSYILNTSAREGCPVTVLEGMAAGLKPLVYDWIGANEIYDKRWIWRTLDDVKRILAVEWQPETYREWVKTNHNFEDIYERINNEIFSKALTAN